MATLTSFDVNRNKPRVPRDRPAFATQLLSTRLRLALAHDPHVPAATEQVRAALDQIEGA